MVYFQTKNPSLGIFPTWIGVARWYIFKPKIPVWAIWGLQWKRLVYFTAISSILRIFGIIYSHLVYLLFIWYTFPHFGNYYREKLATLSGIMAHASVFPYPE
jgi:hypothetical protein